MAEEMELKQGQVLELEQELGQVLELELKWKLERGKVQGLELGLQGMPQSPV